MTNELKKRIADINNGIIPDGYKKTKVGIVPVEWEIVSLKDIFTFQKGASLSKRDISEKGRPLILYGELYTTYKEVTYNIVRKTNKDVEEVYKSKIGDIIIPMSGESPEEISTASCIMMKDVILAGDLIILRTNKANQIFLSYMINHGINKKISNIAQGKSVVHLQITPLGKINFPIPPLTEQQKIAEILSTQDKLISLQEKKIEKLKELKKAYLQKMFPRKGSKYPEIRFKGFTDAWEQRKLGDIASDMVAGGDIDKDLILAEGQYPVIANALTGDGIVGYYDKEYRVNAPAVTVTGRGDVGHAKARLVNFTPVVRLLSVKSEHDVFFLENAINTLKIVIESTGVPQLTVPQLAKYEVAFPRQLDEEEHIGAFFKQLDTLITLHQRKLEKEKEKKKALMQLLLTGKVRVKL